MIAQELAALLTPHLTPYLGTWRNGAIAISIGQPMATLAPATGVQCVITAVPTIKTTPTSRGSVAHERYWELTFRRTAGGASSEMSEIADMMSRYAQVRGVVYVPGTRDTAEQLSCRWFDPQLIDRLI
jgi:hypothetical protein